jgi:CRP-like cAMP-binding protein
MEQAEIGTRTAFPMPLSQIQLGDALGLTPVHVNRTLKVLKQDGLVTRSDKTILVHNWAALARVADFDPAFLLINPQVEREVA